MHTLLKTKISTTMLLFILVSLPLSVRSQTFIDRMRTALEGIFTPSKQTQEEQNTNTLLLGVGANDIQKKQQPLSLLIMDKVKALPSDNFIKMTLINENTDTSSQDLRSEIFYLKIVVLLANAEGLETLNDNLKVAAIKRGMDGSAYNFQLNNPNFEEVIIDTIKEAINSTLKFPFKSFPDPILAHFSEGKSLLNTYPGSLLYINTDGSLHLIGQNEQKAIVSYFYNAGQVRFPGQNFIAEDIPVLLADKDIQKNSKITHYFLSIFNQLEEPNRKLLLGIILTSTPSFLDSMTQLFMNLEADPNLLFDNILIGTLLENIKQLKPAARFHIGEIQTFFERPENFNKNYPFLEKNAEWSSEEDSIQINPTGEQ